MTLELIARVRPRRAVLTHLDKNMDYATLVAELPAGVEPGYDGLEIAL
jgi:phosphoribosyl 1,2-cyclic phosphate phosphodiesterase